MIDCHCHILPGIDDGAKNLDYALDMARVAVSNGIFEIIATPHHMNGVYLNPREKILEEVADFQKQLDNAKIPLRVFPGSELHLVPELLYQLEKGEAMTFGDRGKAVLVELPKHSIPTGSEQILENLLYQGFVPVIAHPERNTTLRKQSERVGEWVSQGCKLQLTSQSCAGEFGALIQEVCQEWCRRGWVHLIASDAHRTERRSPNMRPGAEAVAGWVGEKAMKIVTEINPGALKDGENLINFDPVRAPESKKTKLFSVFRRKRA